MRIIPVLDLMRGLVVHGIAGRRQEYRPIKSPIAETPDPLEIARAIRNHFGLGELYIADLDAIAGCRPAIHVFRTLQDDGFNLLIDAGLRNADDAMPLLALELGGIVAGLETLGGKRELADLVGQVGRSRLVFSLDLKNGQPLTTAAEWRGSSPSTIAAEVMAMGISRFLVLDLARVGTGSGTGTEEICAKVRETCPLGELLAGGGVHGRQDLERLRLAGVDGVLVASALHDGTLSVDSCPLSDKNLEATGN
jgi:phosphoribosylformimino-5-aminoimidazole carboxamide ribotide isomerase